jgi:hypothetical protein
LTLYYSRREHLIACKKHKARLRPPIEKEDGEHARCWFCIQEQAVDDSIEAVARFER